MRCPSCGKGQSKVLDSRSLEDGVAVRRRRECLGCTYRFTTYERVEEPILLVVKKDGRRERFDRTKILAGLRKACEKRPVAAETLEEIVDHIESEIRNTGICEVPTVEIGERIMVALRLLDEVAYVRFASVYREFKDLNTFREELDALRRGDPGRAPREEKEDRAWPRPRSN